METRLCYLMFLSPWLYIGFESARGVEHTFTGTDDKAWFYLVSVAMEAQGGRIISVATLALSHILERDYTAVMALLYSLAAEIDNLGNILGRLHENCNPDVFFHKIRPFLQGG
ncbi:indoleamine -dioxygenase [Colletotrichum incanum]|uniref:Indoleamine-dioxygenase n=1 Tax=Colletotrichum incanum TaxID=1573173 RepID=A0A162Q3R9_COLIC|nr:indoleamine -dioxygenase [Colletotrichum incanum]